jgi:tRNA threonylcarbamoyladenosine biosynthesis protein TsaB
LAQGLGFGLNCPVYPISTLAALAQQARLLHPDSDRLIVPMLDARMQEIYVGGYRADGLNPTRLTCVIDEQLCHPDQLNIYLGSHAEQKRVLIGSGWDRHQELLQKENGFAQIYPRAIDILTLALDEYHADNPGINALAVLPTYLRDNVAG